MGAAETNHPAAASTNLSGPRCSDPPAAVLAPPSCLGINTRAPPRAAKGALKEKI